MVESCARSFGDLAVSSGSRRVTHRFGCGRRRSGGLRGRCGSRVRGGYRGRFGLAGLRRGGRSGRNWGGRGRRNVGSGRGLLHLFRSDVLARSRICVDTSTNRRVAVHVRVTGSPVLADRPRSVHVLLFAGRLRRVVRSTLGDVRNRRLGDDVATPSHDPDRPSVGQNDLDGLAVTAHSRGGVRHHDNAIDTGIRTGFGSEVGGDRSSGGQSHAEFDVEVDGGLGHTPVLAREGGRADFALQDLLGGERLEVGHFTYPFPPVVCCGHSLLVGLRVLDGREAFVEPAEVGVVCRNDGPSIGTLLRRGRRRRGCRRRRGERLDVGLSRISRRSADRPQEGDDERKGEQDSEEDREDRASTHPAIHRDFGCHDFASLGRLVGRRGRRSRVGRGGVHGRRRGCRLLVVRRLDQATVTLRCSSETEHTPNEGASDQEEEGEVRHELGTCEHVVEQPDGHREQQGAGQQSEEPGQQGRHDVARLVLHLELALLHRDGLRSALPLEDGRLDGLRLLAAVALLDLLDERNGASGGRSRVCVHGCFLSPLGLIHCVLSARGAAPWGWEQHVNSYKRPDVLLQETYCGQTYCPIVNQCIGHAL